MSSADDRDSESSAAPSDPITLPLKEKVDRFLDYVFAGAHHVRSVTDKGNYYLVVPHGSMATFDGRGLTCIVIASHVLGLRADIENNGMRGIRILLHNRVCRKGCIAARHPSGHDLIDAIHKAISDE
jgi:hypothetical protein